MPVRLLVSHCSDLSSAEKELAVDKPTGEEFHFETALEALSALPTAGIESLFKNGGGALIQDRDHDRFAIHLRQPDPKDPKKRLPFNVAYLYDYGDVTLTTLKALLPKARERSQKDSLVFQRDLEEMRIAQEEEKEERELHVYANSLKMATPRPRQKFKGRGSLDAAMRSLPPE